MKKHPAVLSLFAFLFLAVASVNAQIFADELRPFDFTDKYYEQNGIIASTLVARKNGADGGSVFDFANDPNLTNIRITATMPAYTGDGAAIFWNYYGGASRASFTADAAGGGAIDLAYGHPMYVFPSTTVRSSDRQAAMIRIGEAYFEKNRIGIAAVFLVEYTERIFTKQGQAAMELLIKRNGPSLDGTPIIRTARELEGLLTDGLVTVRLAGPDNSDRTPYAVAKVLQHADGGAITPDAFLVYVKRADGKPLEAEAHILEMFECMKGGGKCF